MEKTWTIPSLLGLADPAHIWSWVPPASVCRVWRAAGPCRWCRMLAPRWPERFTRPGYQGRVKHDRKGQLSITLSPSGPIWAAMALLATAALLAAEKSVLPDLPGADPRLFACPLFVGTVAILLGLQRICSRPEHSFFSPVWPPWKAVARLLPVSCLLIPTLFALEWCDPLYIGIGMVGNGGCYVTHKWPPQTEVNSAADLVSLYSGRSVCTTWDLCQRHCLFYTISPPTGLDQLPAEMKLPPCGLLCVCVECPLSLGRVMTGSNWPQASRCYKYLVVWERFTPLWPAGQGRPPPEAVHSRALLCYKYFDVVSERLTPFWPTSLGDLPLR